MSKDTGGYAFAAVAPSCNKFDGHLQEGMTLRDYFAAKAMQAAVSGLSSRKDVFSFNECAEFSYDLADAMIAERNKS